MSSKAFKNATKLNQIVDFVADFGADPTGVADCSAALAAFCAYLQANGKTGHVPHGTYKLASAVSVGAAVDWGIEGDSSETVQFVYSGASTTNDIITIGSPLTNSQRVTLNGFTVTSSTVMTAGIGLRLHRLCRSEGNFVIDGQDGSGRLWHGVRFDGVDHFYWNDFQARAQKDAVQVNGLIGATPKAGLFLDNYKICLADVGVRIGGAFGGIYFDKGDIAVCGDGVVIDSTLTAETNREVFFGPVTIDACTRCGVIIDQPLGINLWINFAAKCWIASHASHGVWIKNANSTRINFDAYVYQNGGDGIRIDDSAAIVFFESPIFNGGGGYSINFTVFSTAYTMGSPRFIATATPWNFSTNPTSYTKITWPISIQNGRAFYYDNFDGALTGGAAAVPHGKGSGYLNQVIAVFGSFKTGGGSWQALAATVDATNINLTGGTGAQPYNVTLMVGVVPNTGW